MKEKESVFVCVVVGSVQFTQTLYTDGRPVVQAELIGGDPMSEEIPKALRKCWDNVLAMKRRFENAD